MNLSIAVFILGAALQSAASLDMEKKFSYRELQDMFTQGKGKGLKKHKQTPEKNKPLQTGSAAAACLDFIGPLTVDQLRWAFTSYSLAQVRFWGQGAMCAAVMRLP